MEVLLWLHQGKREVIALLVHLKKSMDYQKEPSEMKTDEIQEAIKKLELLEKKAKRKNNIC